jgi:hypothetical protein
VLRMAGCATIFNNMGFYPIFPPWLSVLAYVQQHVKLITTKNLSETGIGRAIQCVSSKAV